MWGVKGTATRRSCGGVKGTGFQLPPGDHAKRGLEQREKGLNSQGSTRGSCREGVRGETGGEGPGGHTEGREQNGESHRSRYMYIFVEITI